MILILLVFLLPDHTAMAFVTATSNTTAPSDQNLEDCDLDVPKETDSDECKELRKANQEAKAAESNTQNDREFPDATLPETPAVNGGGAINVEADATANTGIGGSGNAAIENTLTAPDAASVNANPTVPDYTNIELDPAFGGGDGTVGPGGSSAYKTRGPLGYRMIEGRPIDWDRIGLGEQAERIAIGDQRLSQSIDLSKVTIHPISPEEVKSFGTIPADFSGPVFGKMLDKKIIPDVASGNLAQRQQAAMSYLANVTGRYTPEQAAGIVGNSTHESNLEPLRDAGGSENSIGLFQLNGVRKKSAELFSQQKFTGFYTSGSKEYYSDGPGFFTQLAYADAELQGTSPVRDYQAEKLGKLYASNPNISATESARLFQNLYERPASRTNSLASRQQYTNSALENYKKGQTTIIPSKSASPNVPRSPTSGAGAQPPSSGPQTTQSIVPKFANDLVKNLSLGLSIGEPLSILSNTIGTLNSLVGLFPSNKQNSGSSYADFPAPTTPDEPSDVTPDVQKVYSISFEVMARDGAGALVQDWTDTDITIQNSDELFFRWYTRGYDSCRPMLPDDTYYQAHVASSTMKFGNTVVEGYNVAEQTGAYSIECSFTENGVETKDSKEINVTVEGPATIDI